MAPQPQASSQRRQPVHLFSLSTATPKKSPTVRSGSPRLSASNGQTWMHSSQPLPMQLSSTTIAFGHSLRGNVRLLIAGTPAKAIGLQLLRLAGVAVLFAALAKLGAWPLLCGAAGLLLARGFILRRVQVTS